MYDRAFGDDNHPGRSCGGSYGPRHHGRRRWARRAVRMTQSWARRQAQRPPIFSRHGRARASARSNHGQVGAVWAVGAARVWRWVGGQARRLMAGGRVGRWLDVVAGLVGEDVGFRDTWRKMLTEGARKKRDISGSYVRDIKVFLHYCLTP
jgi:hypothetical protein